MGKHLEGWDGVALEGLDYLFIENVGNLVCPSSYDLGERMRVALLSVTEGEDKPLKYPTLFNSADAAVITKMDIAEPCGFDREAALKNISEIRPGIRIFETSAKTGAGMEEWLGVAGGTGGEAAMKERSNGRDGARPARGIPGRGRPLPGTNTSQRDCTLPKLKPMRGWRSWKQGRTLKRLLAICEVGPGPNRAAE